MVIIFRFLDFSVIFVQPSETAHRIGSENGVFEPDLGRKSAFSVFFKAKICFFVYEYAKPRKIPLRFLKNAPNGSPWRKTHSPKKRIPRGVCSDTPRYNAAILYKKVYRAYSSDCTSSAAGRRRPSSSKAISTASDLVYLRISRMR